METPVTHAQEKGSWQWLPLETSVQEKEISESATGPTIDFDFLELQNPKALRRGNRQKI